jgi:hypothetical protein
MSIARLIFGFIALLLVLAAIYVGGAWLRLYGEHEGAGEPTASRIPQSVVEARTRERARAAAALTVGQPKQILFGDLHVHTTFSTDAFLWSLPMMQGEGAHPVGDACDYARFCSALDFWSINDHAEASTPLRWQETTQAIRQCNAVTGNTREPDVVAFIGWEWTQVGRVPEDHYGHKNVIFPGLESDEIPTRPIGAAGVATDGLRGGVATMPTLMPLLDLPNRQRYYNFIEFIQETRNVPRCSADVGARELNADCYESAATPRELFDKLDQWGFDTIVIPHGNTWGFYTPPGSTLDKQLTAQQNDPGKQIIFEIMSGHGNSEEYRDWRATRFDADGNPTCPEPTPDYLPSCWRAGEIIESRCLAAGIAAPDCEARAAEARQNYVAGGVAGHRAIPGVEFEDWLDSGQCKDCFQPSFNYRPGGSGQYALAISNFDTPADPKRFRFGFIASSDNHRARPGTGYKEFDRLGTTEASGARDATWRRRIVGPREDPNPRATVVDPYDFSRGFLTLEAERQASFFMTGGLAAVHSQGRSRSEIWDALKRKEVYGTSGDRILLWFNLLNAEAADGTIRSIPMGSEARMVRAPRFEVRAVGAFQQKPGCPEYSSSALTAEQLQRLCKGECYNPSDRRKRISRIEVVRIRPQISPDEPVGSLIEDPWRVFSCEPSESGCVVQFEDPGFVEAERNTAYYVRAIEEPSLAVNARNLRCEYDEAGNCIEVDPCYGSYRTDPSDDCAVPIEERAWSSPIYVDFTDSGAYAARR